MLNVTKDNNRITVETGSVILGWDLHRGGQLVRCDLKEWNGTHPLLSGGAAAPNLTLEIDGKRIGVADFPCEAAFGRQDDQCFIFTTKSRLGDLFTFEQRYEVFREGVVFCEFSLQLSAGQRVVVRNADLQFNLAVGSAKTLRQCYVSRDPYVKQDVTCIHVLSDHEICLPPDRRSEKPHLLPLVGMDLGWAPTRYFSHRVELMLEDTTSIGGDLLGPTRTVAAVKDGVWQVAWQPCINSSQELQSPFFYRNKWALLCGAGRNQTGRDADAAHRNNVMASRICHVMYPYVRAGSEWPLVSIPIRQTFYQDAQLATENPGLERVDEAADLGCNFLILHQFWMTNGGSNGEPMAEYKAFDPAWLTAFVDKAHARGMRVGFYMRGIEHYSLYSDFFEQFLQKDYDGLYVDWATPFGMGYCKTSAMHCSAYNWFMVARALRRRVGESGFLIGHSALQTYISFATFDAVLTGEFSVMHSGLLNSPEISASYAAFGCCGVHLIAGNSPDRAAFSSQRSAAFSAGMGYSNHPFMEPGKSFAECSAFLHPLWNLWRALGDQPRRVFNPAIGCPPVVTWSDERLHPVVYQAADGKTLILVTNLSDQPVSGQVDVDFAKLGLPATAKLSPLAIEGTYPPKVQGNRITVANMPPYFYGGLLVQR